MIEERIISLKKAVYNAYSQRNLIEYYEHTERVVGYTMILTSKDIDVEYVIAAAWIHDVGRIQDNSFIGHIRELKNVALPLLLGVGYVMEEADIVIEIASKHHPAHNEHIASKAAQIIFDADNLDLIGAIGLFRWFGKFPSHTKELVPSAQLFIDQYNEQVKNNGRFFYTDVANIIGAGRLYDTLEYCRKTVEEVDLIYSKNQFDLSICQLYTQGAQENKNEKRCVFLLSGFRCSGKSYVITLIRKLFGEGFNYFITNSVPTGDKDANIISPREVIKRYGKNGTYLSFMEKQLQEFHSQTEGPIIIDSVKSEADCSYIKTIYPHDRIITIWLHSCYDVRLQRYTNRDIKNGIRNTPLNEHDKELIDLGILPVMKEATYIINTDQSESSIIAELCRIIAETNTF